jgi:catechol 2,3-dioxygenase-like lactoylglutathione lyase family enzyme
MGFTLHGICPLLQVFDMPTSLRFYRDVLGFSVIQRSGEGDDVGWALLTLRGAELMLNTAYERGERPPTPVPARVQTHDDTALFFGCENLESLHAHLRAGESDGFW